MDGRSLKVFAKGVVLALTYMVGKSRDVQNTKRGDLGLSIHLPRCCALG